MATARTSSAVPVVVASVVCGWWATGLDPFSTRATWIVLAAGVVAMVVGRVTRRAGPPADIPPRATAPWSVLAGALMAWQLAAYFQHPRSEHPTLSSLTNTALDPRPIRALAFAAWMLAAGWLARR